MLQAVGVRGMSGGADLVTDDFVTVVTGGQLFGLKLERVRDVFVPRRLSRVPLAPPEVAGLLNLRGRIVTAIDLRERLGLDSRSDDIVPVAVGIEERGELYGLIVDKVGDVLRLAKSSYEPNPVNLDNRWAGVCSGVYRIEGNLMVVLDVDKVLELSLGIAA
jgi:purine-binding chemotaxis protein CheW